VDPRIRIVLRIIDEQQGNFRVPLTTTRKLLGLSQTRLLRLFKLGVGKTLSQYLRQARMTRAAQLVELYDVPIKEVAHQCGYDDMSNFYRDFRKVHKMTPHGLRARQIELLYDSKEPLRGAIEPLRADQRPQTIVDPFLRRSRQI
jgi:AraC-like DNA-binding protein